jgi:hypothetical protein
VSALAAGGEACQRMPRQAAVEAVGLRRVELRQSGLPEACQLRALAPGVSMSSTGVVARWPTVCSMPASQNG